jgi:hypothetical protein
MKSYDAKGSAEGPFMLSQTSCTISCLSPVLQAASCNAARPAIADWVFSLGAMQLSHLSALLGSRLYLIHATCISLNKERGRPSQQVVVISIQTVVIRVGYREAIGIRYDVGLALTWSSRSLTDVRHAGRDEFTTALPTP